MNYYAMINGERKGPLPLADLCNLGIMPDTYVWSKGMADWQQAKDVKAISDFWKEKLTPSHKTLQNSDFTTDAKPHKEENVCDKGVETSLNPMQSERQKIYDALQEGLQRATKEQLPENFKTVPPKDLRFFGLIMTIFFFFPTGLVSLYYARKSQNLWKQWINSNKEENKPVDENLAYESYDSARQATMWGGISFFLGLIFYPLIFKFFI